MVTDKADSSDSYYVDKDGKVHKYIYCFKKEKVTAWGEKYIAGWYFENEIYDLYGPYGSFEEVTEMFKAYFKDVVGAP
jgi:hypothetical protein